MKGLGNRAVYSENRKMETFWILFSDTLNSKVDVRLGSLSC
jgi:hypothetical protein